MAHEVLDIISEKLGFKRTDDFTLGEKNGFLTSVTEDKIGIFEVNFLFRRTDRKSIEELKNFTEENKKKFCIAKFRVKGENLSLVIPKGMNREKDAQLITAVIEYFTGYLSGNFMSDSKEIVTEHEKYRNKDDKIKDPKETMKKIRASVPFSLSVSVIIIAVLWWNGKNVFPYNYLIPFISPIIIGIITSVTGGKKIPVRLTAGISFLMSILGIYIGTILKVMNLYETATPVTLSDAFYNVNRALTHGDTLNPMSIIKPLLISFPLIALGTLISEKIFKNR